MTFYQDRHMMIVNHMISFQYPSICITHCMRDIIKIERKERYLVQMCSQTKSNRVKLPEVHGAKKILDTNLLPEKQKVILQIKKTIESKPRLGQGRAGIRCRKPQLTKSITVSTSKSCEIPKIPATQNVPKNRMDFPVQVQSITNKTEAIIRGMIQDKNRLPFYPDPIYWPPPRPPEIMTTEFRK